MCGVRAMRRLRHLRARRLFRSARGRRPERPRFDGDRQVNGHAGLRRQLDRIIGPIGRELIGCRRERNTHIALDTIKADIAQAHVGSAHARCIGCAALRAAQAAHFEHVLEVAGERDGKRHTRIGRTVVRERDGLVQHRTRKNAHPLHVNDAFARTFAADGRQGTIREVRGEGCIVLADVAGKQRRRPPAEGQPQLGQRARVVDEEAVVEAVDIAQRIVDDERIARFEHVLARSRDIGVFGGNEGAVGLAFARVARIVCPCRSTQCVGIQHRFAPDVGFSRL